MSIKNSIKQQLDSYINKSEIDLINMFNIDISSTTKNKFSIISAAMLGIKGSINKSNISKQNNIIVKTIRLDEKNNIKEHMSFPTINFTELANESWETSKFRNYLIQNTILFIVFKKEKQNFFFHKYIFWNIPAIILEGPVKDTWLLTNKLLKNGEIIKDFKNNKYISNFPGSSFNHICHVRPHDSCSIDKSEKGAKLPFPDKLTGLVRYTKHCFWIDRKYLLSLIND